MLQVQPTQTRSKPETGPSDAALVVAARAGEKWAQEALFRRYSRMVNGLAFRLLGRDQDVDDLVQDSFLSALRSLDRLEEPQAFASWLGSIVVRSAHKLLRRRKLLTRLGLRKPAEIDLDQVIAPSAPPSVAVELRKVYGCLNRLEPEARIALVLHRVDGLSIPEVAAQMKLSASTVKRRLKVAEQHLAVHVADAGVSHG
jgi:RNA polymerase sigma-70 factor (ECF subfamily)